jgi:hypothetical protein
MKSNEIVERIIADYPSGLDNGNILDGLVQETLDIIKIRHAQQPSAVKAVIDEVEQKWFAVIRKLKVKAPDIAELLSPTQYRARFIKKEHLLYAITIPKKEMNEWATLNDSTGTLSAEHIKNWRRVLPAILGPFAFMMTDEMIQKFRDGLQRRVNFEEEKRLEKEKQLNKKQ